MHEFPISETFVSIQGEGEHVGKRMLFVRFAGCNVGKHMSDEQRQEFDRDAYNRLDMEDRELIDSHKLNVIQSYQDVCTSVTGTKFPCDTNYKKSTKMTADDIVKMAKESEVEYVTFTGGEPFIQNQSEFYILLCMLSQDNFKVHIETSGTVLIKFNFGNHAWIVCSPKQGFLEENLTYVSELKFLVDADFSVDKLPECLRDSLVQYSGNVNILNGRGLLISFQPVNDEHSINMANVKRCMDLQKIYTHARLSIQLHKVLGVE